MAEQESRVFSTVVYTVTCLLGCVSNSLVITAFVRNSVKHRSLPALDMVILNKASTNLLLCLTRDFTGVLYGFVDNLLKETSCQLYIYLSEVLRVVSLQSLILLSFLHYIKIRRPNYKSCMALLNCQRKCVSVALGMLWLASILMHLPYLGYKARITKREDSNITGTNFGKFANCMFDFDENSHLNSVRFSIMALDLCSMGALVVLSCSIVGFLWTHRWKVVPSPASRAWTRGTLQATQVILTFLFLYLFCWVSSYILWIIILGLNTHITLLQQMASAMPSVYYSTSSFALMFGYKKVRDQFNRHLLCFKVSIKGTVVSVIQ